MLVATTVITLSYNMPCSIIVLSTLSIQPFYVCLYIYFIRLPPLDYIRMILAYYPYKVQQDWCGCRFIQDPTLAPIARIAWSGYLRGSQSLLGPLSLPRPVQILRDLSMLYAYRSTSNWCPTPKIGHTYPIH
jgi:hypothetical protein